MLQDATATRTAPELPVTIDFPSIWCPIPARVHPDVAGIDDHLLDWARRFDLIREEPAASRFHSAGFGQFAASVYPRALQLQLVAEWQGHNWIVDDRIDEGHAVDGPEERRRLARELIAQMPLDLHPPRPSGPLAAALSDLWQRTAKPFSYAWRTRYVAHYRDFLAFTILPHSGPDQSRLSEPELHAFIRRRRLNSGCEMSFDLVEVANLREVPAIVADSDSYRAVRVAANDVISWTNDIFSLRKESVRGDLDHLSAVLRNAMRTDWQEALKQSADMVAALTRDFLDACEDLRAMRPVYDLDDAAWETVEESLTDLGEWISGSLYWHWWSPRYRVVETTTPEGQPPAYIERHLV